MLLTDFRHALRGLRHRSGFTLVAVLTLALGIGATTAIFSALYHTLLRPMPYQGGERMMYVWLTGGQMMIAPGKPHVDAWRQRARSFDLIAEYEEGEYVLYGGSSPEVIAGTAIERDLPRKLGVEPVLGRGFTAEEMRPNGRRAVVLSEALWKTRFAGRRDVLGEQLELGEERYEVVGVMPNRLGAFTGRVREAGIWLPLRPVLDTTKFSSHNVLVRLREGVDTAQANAELKLLSQHVQRAGGDIAWVPQVVLPATFVDGAAQRGLPILFAAVGAVLLIGCANIAGLLLVRMTARRRELAVRAAIGANRASILSLLGAESLLLALGGGSLGVLLSAWLLELVRLARPDTLGSVDAASLSGATLLFALVVTLATTVLFGAVPAFSAVRRNPLQPLLSGGGAGARVTGGNRMRSLLVTGQIALSLTLLVAALLLVRTVGKLESRDVGFEPDGVLALRLELPDARYPDAAQRRLLLESLLPALERLPGVTAVAHGSGIPTRSGMMLGAPQFADRPLAADEQPRMLGFNAVSAGYAEVLGIELVEGRFLTGDKDGGVVLSEDWAKQLWPGQSAVGRRIRLSDEPDAEWDRVVGVAREIRTSTTGVAAHPHVYVDAEYNWGHAWLVLRTSRAEPLSLIPQVQAVIDAMDSRLVPRDFTTMNAVLADTIAMQRFFMLLLATFAGLALLLSVVGLYGVISQAVAQRTAEIGVRLALGATPSMVRSLVLRHGLRLLGAGLLAGGAGTAAAVRLIRTSLYGVQPWDPFSFLAAAAVLAAAALLATYIPARRALRVDPLTALRAE